MNIQLRLRLGLAVALLISCLLFATNSVRSAAAGESPTLQGNNLLQNPGFEGRFHAWSSIPEVQVAANWTPWWWEDPDHNPAYFRPEYKRALASVFPKRVLSGESAQQWFTFHASHVAGMYQQVFDVTPGQHYRFSIWAQVWSSSEDNPRQSVLPANPHLQIGIDPTGNWSPGASTVIWSGEAPMSGVIDQWGLMIMEAKAENNVITVFMRTNPDFANKHNDMYWDNAGLEAVQPPPPTAPPSPTSGPATSTPEITATNAAAETPSASRTPSPTATDTISPTATNTATLRPPTPAKTATATRTPTVTPEPTATPSATRTPIASATPSPAEIVADSDANPTGEAGALSTSTPAAEAAANDNQSVDSDEQINESESEPDKLSVVALVAIGLAVALLLLLIYILARNLRRG